MFIAKANLTLVDADHRRGAPARGKDLAAFASLKHPAQLTTFAILNVASLGVSARQVHMFAAVSVNSPCGEKACGHECAHE